MSRAVKPKDSVRSLLDLSTLPFFFQEAIVMSRGVGIL